MLILTPNILEFNGATVERPNTQCRKRNAEIPAANTYVVAKLGNENASSTGTPITF